MSTPISVFIITKDEEARIADAIKAVIDWADEVVVLDSGSTDRTCVIAAALGAKVHFREWSGYGPQKRAAEELCVNRWVLNVDADEVVTPELAAEIRGLFASEPAPGAYRVRILTVYPGDERPRPLANDYNVVRLYHRGVGRYRDHPVFDRVEIGAHRARQLSAPIYHYTHLSVDHAVRKAMAFSEFRAAAGEQRKPGVLRLAVEFPLAFLKSYIGRRHFTGGWKGFYFAIVQAFMRTTRIARMLEEQTKGPAGAGH